MNKFIKNTIKALTPPIIISTAKKIFSDSESKLYGPYDSWVDATQVSSGYDANNILQTVAESCRAVRDGKAVYERDSVLFDNIEYSWGLTASLMWGAASHDGNLRIIDFGGSLGSTYRGNIRFLQDLQYIDWNIIEQSHFVSLGKHEFENHELHFYNSIIDVINEKHIDGIICSGVLQYLEKPYEILKKIVDCNCDYIVLDRTLLCTEEENIFVQKVPNTIYPAKYPCWKLSRQKIENILSEKYEIRETFLSPVDGFSTWGCLAVRKNFKSSES